jgi:hypothetical protein
MHVDAIKQRTGDLLTVALYLVDVAVAAPGRIIEISARAPLRCLFAI